MVAAGIAAFVRHHSDAASHAASEILVPVAGDAQIVRIAHRNGGRAADICVGRLGRGVDAAARRAAAEGRSGWSLEDFDLAVVERVARVDAEVAQAVGEDVVLGRDAADEELVAAHDAAFTDLRGDAGHVAQGLLERGDALLLQDLAGDDVHGLRNFLDVDGRESRSDAAAVHIDAVTLRIEAVDACLLRLVSGRRGGRRISGGLGMRRETGGGQHQRHRGARSQPARAGKPGRSEFLRHTITPTSLCDCE